MRDRLSAVLVLLSLPVRALAHCGGLSSQGGADGSDETAARDASRQETTADRATDVPADRDAATDGSAPHDEGAAPDAFVEELGPDAFPYPHFRDAALDGCPPGACTLGQVCVELAGGEGGGGNVALCAPEPVPCEHGSRCTCIVQAATWCGDPRCSADGGHVVLLCMPEPPP
jgi:hypothetical protein